MSKKKTAAPVPVTPTAAEGGQANRAAIERKPRTIRRINGRVLLYGLLFLTVIIGGFVGLHAMMVDRNADVLLEQATAAEKRGDYREAAGHVSRYLRLRPGDVDALERLADLLGQSSNSLQSWTEVLASLEHVLRQEPERHEARHTAIETAFKLRRFRDADRHLEILAVREPQLRAKPALMLTAARTSLGLRDTRRATVRYAELIDTAPTQVSAYAELADLIASKPSDVPVRELLEDQERKWKEKWLLDVFPEKRGEKTAEDVAKELLKHMIENGKPLEQAYLARASFFRSHGHLPEASADVQQALQSGGAELSETYEVAAAIELAQSRKAAEADRTAEASKHRAAAKEFAEKGLQTTSPDPRLYLVLAELEVRMQSERMNEVALESAEKHLRAGLERVDEARQKLDPGDFGRAQRLVESEVLLRWTLADLVMDRLDVADNETEKESLRKAAGKELDALRESGVRPELIDFLEARMLIQEEKWSEAIAALETNRAALVAFPELRERIDFLLGELYLIVNNPDRRVEVFRRALADSRTSEATRISLANSLSEAGRLDEAIEEYRRVPDNPSAALEVARLTLKREWQKPPEQRDLSQVDEFLALPDTPDSIAPGAALVRAQREMAGGDVEAASKALAESTEKFPDEISLWQASVVLETQRTDLEDEEKIARAEDRIRNAEKRFEDRAELRLAKVEVARLRGTETLKDELSRQVASSAELAPAARVKLLENLVPYAALTKEPARVEELWKQVLSLEPNSVPAWLALASLSLESGKGVGVERALEKIRSIEGRNGPNGNFLHAAWRLREISSNEELREDGEKLRTELDGLREELKRAANERKRWPAVPRLLGIVESLAGNSDQAFAYYRRAFELGDRSPQTLQGLVDFHYAKGNFEAADAVIQQVERERSSGVSPGLARDIERVALAKQDIDAALEWTKRVSSRGEIRGKLVSAHVLFLKYRSLDEADRKGDKGQKYLVEARKLYQSVVDLSPEQPEAWLSYVVHFSRIGDKETALAAIEEAKTKLPQEPAARRFASLAQYYEVVQELGEAAKHYRLAVEADSSDPVIRRVAADFFLRNGQFAEANEHLDYLLDPKNSVADFHFTWARRNRALTTAAAGRYEDVRRALNMLRGQSLSPEQAALDLRAQLAVLLRQSALQDRRDRIELFEQLQKHDKLSQDEKLQLASLYSHTDHWPKARKIYDELLQAGQPTAVLLSEFIAAALRSEPADGKLAAQLKPRLEQLTALEKDSIRTAITVARYENAFGRADAAADALTTQLNRVTGADSADGEKVTSQERVELRVAAEAAEELKLFSAADVFFKAVAEHAERPEDALVLATFLGRRGRYSAALDVCEKFAGKALPDATAVTAVNVISSGPVPPDQLARAEALVLKAQESEPDSLRIMTALAGLRTIQGQYMEAESLYRRVRADQPENVAVLNNLAWLLAMTGSTPDEASQLVEEAIRISGPAAALLDTRATVALSRKQVDRAIADLETANADTPTPYLGFHLALAYDQAGKREAARKQLQAAISGGLTLQDLHPSEIGTYQKLCERLGVPGPSV